MSALLFTAACKKEVQSLVPEAGSTPAAVGSSRADCGSDFTKVCHDHILSFYSQAEFDYLYECLQTLYDDHYQAVLDQYGYMNDTDFNDQLDNMGFDEDQPLIDFETSVGFSSYRAHWRQIEDDWLANGADPNNDPTEHNMVGDPVLETLLSEEGMVEIGGVLIWVDPEGQWVNISPWHCEDAEALVHGTYTGTINQFLKGYQSICGTCLEEIMHHGPVLLGPTRKVKWRHEHAYDPDHNYVGIRAVQKCYRKRAGILWGRWRTNQSIHVWGEFTNSDPALNPPCPRFAYDGDRAARYWRLVMFTYTWNGQPPGYCMPDCAPHAEFSVGGNVVATDILCE